MTRKYVRDYKFSETVDERGRIRTEAVYVGEYYRLAEPERARHTAFRLMMLCIFVWAAYIAALLPQSRAMHSFYIALPFIFSALPAGLLTGAAFRVRRADGRFVRSEADKISDRAAPCGAWLMILSGSSAVGELVTLLSAPETVTYGDVLFSVCAVLMCAAGVCVLRMRGAFATAKTED